MPPAETSILERYLHPELLDISFNNSDGSKKPTLEKCFKRSKQVPSMIMSQIGTEFR